MKRESSKIEHVIHLCSFCGAGFERARLAKKISDSTTETLCGRKYRTEVKIENGKETKDVRDMTVVMQGDAQCQDAPTGAYRLL